MPQFAPGAVLDRYRRALERRSPWEPIWQECYDFVLPHRAGSARSQQTIRKGTDRLFDGTAPDAADQLAASLMSQLTAAGARWFNLVVGPQRHSGDHRAISAVLDEATQMVLSHLDRSNFAVEIHQCYLDLVTVGTACLLFEEARPGDGSAFRFTAVPVTQIALEEGDSGRLETTFRRTDLPASHAVRRFPRALDVPALANLAKADPIAPVRILESVIPSEGAYAYLTLLESTGGPTSEPVVLAEGRFLSSPFISFRWLKAPGEIYGRSPVMKALPDIKTANKVVELVLKNATIAVTGIWQADDDGVLNPANIRLVPGTVIPKAVGSAGLTPLQAPGRFDVSEIVLDQLRARIRRALYVDQLGLVHGPRMTATEVLERSAEMARLLGATFGRLQSELLTPLIGRALAILSRRGEIEPVRLDGRQISLEYRSPQARYQAQQDAQNILLWLGAVRDMGPEALATVDRAAAARWLARAFGVPGSVLSPELPIEALAARLALDVEDIAGVSSPVSACLSAPDSVR